jgi:hypothetical protein
VVGSHTPVSSELPDAVSQFQVPEKILQRRIISRGVKHVHQALIQWSFSPASLATWQDLIALRQRFLKAHAWGQAAPVERGNVNDMAAECLAGTMEEDSSVKAQPRSTKGSPTQLCLAQNGCVSEL